jgi:3-oxoacyl-[acyl-carrier-protein] synthase III
MKDNMKKMVSDHNAMKSWHETSAKAAAEQMQDHIKAAAWHDSQVNMIKGMINEVPLDPEKKVSSVPTGGSASAPTTGAGMTSPTKEVALDPKTVKKSDLIEILSEHEGQFGKFDMAVEDIASFLLAE